MRLTSPTIAGVVARCAALTVERAVATVTAGVARRAVLTHEIAVARVAGPVAHAAFCAVLRVRQPRRDRIRRRRRGWIGGCRRRMRDAATDQGNGGKTDESGHAHADPRACRSVYIRRVLERLDDI